MGEPQPSQPQSPKPENPNPIPPHNSDDSASISGSIVSSTTIETPRITDLTNVSSPPSKIPLRPRKIRKLSPSPNKTSPRPFKPSRIHAKSLTCEGELSAAITHLRTVDPLLSSLIDTHPPPKYESFTTPFLALIRSILYQQLAAKAGNSIYTRFVSLCGGENGVVPENVLPLTPQELRQIGVSGRKASYLHDLARKYQNGILSDSGIVSMDDKSLFTMLTMVNGIGSWSVHMFMINSLHRPDVLPVNDLGVRKGVQMLYNLPEVPRPSQMEGLCEKWRPYRSVGSWYMWRLVEARGTPSSAAVGSSGGDMSFPQLEEMQQQQQQQQQSQLLDPLSVFSIGAWGQT
ncbi:unnamed protein product [Eruca vesicaria subsp. sativa]|uniref:HhH-GPD domain-containing protein n=1 Tax=Eruca vesicaria subsp. sativa TaxID=29727 RepID=A0ABC8KXK3_ERUVS|nr:unnamed protein product [Eruca vesicaria subsp. sativa]